MNPNKVRNLIPSFAMDMNRSVDEVQTVISFYYKTIRQKLSNLEGVNVQVENLGKFYIKEKALEGEINKCKYVIEGLSNNTLKEYAYKIDYNGRLEKMQSIKEMLMEEKQKRKDVNTKRFGNESRS